MKDIFVVSHCILNNASKVEQDEAELEAEYIVRDKLMDLVSKNHIQLLQLPCPEFIIYGSKRWGHVKDQFDNPFFRKSCKEMLEPIMLQLEEYCSREDAFRVLGIVSVEGSPSCGYKLTCTAPNWKGEIGICEDHIREIATSVEMVPDKGVLMDVLEGELKSRGLDVPIITMEEAINRIEEII